MRLTQGCALASTTPQRTTDAKAQHSGLPCNSGPSLQCAAPPSSFTVCCSTLLAYNLCGHCCTAGNFRSVQQRCPACHAWQAGKHRPLQRHQLRTPTGSASMTTETQGQQLQDFTRTVHCCACHALATHRAHSCNRCAVHMQVDTSQSIHMPQQQRRHSATQTVTTHDVLYTEPEVLQYVLAGQEAIRAGIPAASHATPCCIRVNPC
jgi:hypothetical protein